MAVSIDDFRAAMSRWATGITVVTSRAGDQVAGMVANSFAGVSTDPLTVLFCADHATRTYPLIKDSGTFAVSILAQGQEDTFWVFAGRKGSRDADRFAGQDVITAVTGAPIFRHSQAWFDCRVVAEHKGGNTHTIFVGEVLATELGTAAHEPPLVYYHRRVRHLADATEE